MTNKQALDALQMIENNVNLIAQNPTMQDFVRRVNCYFPTIRATLTLATESEQLRKERDELARAVVLADYQGVDDDTLKLAKRIIENGNA